MNVSHPRHIVPTKQPRLHLSTAGKLWFGYFALIAATIAWCLN